MKAQLLKPFYSKAVEGLPLLGTPAEAARRFATGSPEEDSRRLIAFYTGLGGATGFACGLPGFLMLPLTLPANIAGVAVLQLHMSAALAVMGGHDERASQTRDRCIGCLLEKLDETGKNSEEEEVASRTGIKLMERGVRLVAEQTTRLAGRAARGFALRRLGRRLPLVGGILGASSDVLVTRYVGRCAREAFLEQ